MTNIKECRMSIGLSQKELADELQVVCPGIDASLISKIEHGLAEPTEAVSEYVYKALASRKTGDETSRPINYPFDAEDLVNRPIFAEIYAELLKATRNKPASRHHLVLMTGASDREIRKCIREMREAGIRVASSSSSCGYWICDDADYRVLRNELKARAMSMLSMISLMDKADPNQVRMDL